MIDEPPRPPWQMDWTKQAQHDFQNMPAEGSDLIMSARAELITAVDPYFRGIDADASLPHWMTVRPLASTSPGGPHIVDLAGGRGWLIYTFMRRHADPQIVVTEAFWA
ncbi:hypothetical protein [Streptomyces cyaneofuscatus]|uniref:hypothetical protein n=1 Tax=Streptomyces cyaneofuscatus TaxID=66883 RepID=UPI00386424D7|nr:hypothetical protein OG973_19395 [Streptomyces cyaneofuscatus]